MQDLTATITPPVPCEGLGVTEVRAGDPCQSRTTFGGPIRSFVGAVGVRFSCIDVSSGNEVRVGIDLSACSERQRFPNDVIYDCTNALDLAVDQDSGPAFTVKVDAEVALSNTRLNLGSVVSDQQLCGTDVERVAVDFSFEDPVFNIDDPTKLPQTLIPTGFFEAAGFALVVSAGQFLVVGRLTREIGVGEMRTEYDCGMADATVDCAPTPDDSPVGTPDAPPSTTVRVQTSHSFPTRTLVSIMSRRTLDPGPVNLRIESTFDSQGSAPLAQAPSGGILFPLNLLLLPNTSILPHIPFGQGGPFLIGTQIVINNPHLEDVDGELQFFSTADGQPLEVTIGETTDSRHNFNVGAVESRVLEIDASGVDPPQIAWAFIQGTRELTAATNFSTLDTSAAASEVTRVPQAGGSIPAEAGIAASGVGLRHVLSVSSDGVLVDAAFAILNPTLGTANIDLKLKSQDGQVAAQADLVLESHHQVARFFWQFFGLEAGPFLGTLEINSDTSLAVISIRTQQGLQSSSLPSGTP